MLLHADADAFFASVEARDRPDLRGRPFAVVAGVVCCASYEARALGVTAGSSSAVVARRWPQVELVELRSGAYEPVGEQLFALFHDLADRVEPGSVEEAFLGLDDDADPAAVERAREVAVGLRRRARDEIGLPVSVGVGRTKLMAKLASRRAKPDGLVVVDPREEAALRPLLRLDELWGVGPATVGALHAAGFTTVADVAHLGEAGLRRYLGTAMARRVASVADGTDDREVRPRGPRRSASAERSLPRGTRAATTVHRALADRVATALARVPDDGRVPTWVEVVVRYDDGTDDVRRRPLRVDGTDVAGAVSVLAHDLLRATGFEVDGRAVALVGVSLTLPAPRGVEGQLLLPGLVP